VRLPRYSAVVAISFKALKTCHIIIGVGQPHATNS
jgi:hypothetical protein